MERAKNQSIQFASEQSRECGLSSGRSEPALPIHSTGRKELDCCSPSPRPFRILNGGNGSALMSHEGSPPPWNHQFVIAWRNYDPARSRDGNKSERALDRVHKSRDDFSRRSSSRLTTWIERPHLVSSRRDAPPAAGSMNSSGRRQVLVAS